MSLLAKIEDVLPGLMREYKATGGFTNWHGSPHKFDRFSMQKIGTGQGAQAFGMGHYTADYRPVAEDYQKTLSHEQPSYAHPQFGVVSPSKLKEYLSSIGVAAGKGKVGQLKAMQIGAEVEKTARRGQEGLIRMHERVGKGVYPDQKVWQEVLQAASNFEHVPNKGHLYQTLIKGHPVEDFLQYDRPLSQQSEKVRGAMENLRVPITDQMGTMKEASEDLLRQLQRSGQHDNRTLTAAINATREAKTPRDLENAMVKAYSEARASPLADDYRKLMTSVVGRLRGVDTFGSGRGGYEQLVNRLGGKTKASEALASEGILGARFLDAGSRGVGQGTYNTISFSDDVIEIVKRYGVAALISAGVISEEMGRALQQQGIDSTFEEEPVA